MRMLSLDASSTSIGYVVWDDDEVRTHGTARLNTGKARDDLGLRLTRAADAIDTWLAEFCPEQVACEGAAHHAQPLALLAQAEVRGVLRLACRRVGLVLLDVPPATAKKALTGRGNADKAQMEEHARCYLVGAFDEHAADAVGVGLGAQALLRGDVQPRRRTKKAAGR